MKDPYRGPIATRPRQPAQVEPRLREDEPTLARCTWCAGCGVITPDQAITLDKMIEHYKEST